ncbi:hypothetical protein BH18THE2_BH18THE2_41360 [soil metagenome]
MTGGICSICKEYCESINHTPAGKICNTCVLILGGFSNRLEEKKKEEEEE